jgi:hypothetical protein
MSVWNARIQEINFLAGLLPGSCADMATHSLVSFPRRGDREYPGRFVAPKGQENLAQGLPWVRQKNVFSPEGALRPECHSHDRKAILAAWYCPFRANPVGNLTQGKPWAKLSWPVGLKTRFYPRPRFWERAKLQSVFGVLNLPKFPSPNVFPLGLPSKQ